MPGKHALPYVHGTQEYVAAVEALGALPDASLSSVVGYLRERHATITRGRHARLTGPVLPRNAAAGVQWARTIFLII